MSGKRHVTLSDDERIGAEVEAELSSDSYYSDEPKPPKKKQKKQPPPSTRSRIPSSRRLEVISKKIQGVEDPEFSCVQNASKKSWVVRRRKFPLDQTPKIEAQSGTVPPPQPVQQPEPPHQAPQQTNSNVSWLNQQPAGNDDLRRDLKMLADKFDRMADKYEEQKKKIKKAKAKKQPSPSQQQEEDEIDPAELAELKSRYKAYLKEQEEEARRPPPAPQQPPAKPVRPQPARYTPSRGRVSIFDF
jgi:uncharacterized protein YdcH (DUF465 family)